MTLVLVVLMLHMAADVAGIHYSTSPEGVLGVELRVDGFSHKLPLLVQRIFSCLLVPEVREAKSCGVGGW